MVSSTPEQQPRRRASSSARLKDAAAQAGATQVLGRVEDVDEQQA